MRLHDRWGGGSGRATASGHGGGGSARRARVGVLTASKSGSDIGLAAHIRSSPIPPRTRQCRGKWSIGCITYPTCLFSIQSGVHPLIGFYASRGGVRRDRVSKSIDVFLGVGYPTPQGNIPGSPSVSVEGDCGIFLSLTAPEEMALAAFVTK